MLHISPINAAHLLKNKVGDNGVPKDWWDNSWDLFFGRIVSENLYPVEVNELSEECYKKLHEPLSATIIVLHIVNAAIHNVMICMLQALLISTDTQACE